MSFREGRAASSPEPKIGRKASASGEPAARPYLEPGTET